MSVEPVIVGVGNAGVSLLDLIALRRPGWKGLIAVNNDPDSLRASVAHARIAIPEGDPAEGFPVIDRPFAEALPPGGPVILCGGLGGVTGSFFLPGLAAHAKASGRIVLGAVGLPFSIEGKERRASALAALKKLREISDGVSVIDYDRLSAGNSVSASVGEAFRLGDDYLMASVLSLAGMISSSGPVRITRNDLHAVLGPGVGETHCGFGSAEGENRLHEALERALKSPLLLKPPKVQAIRSADRLLLLLEGGSDISFAEVQGALSEIERITPAGCQIKTGVMACGPAGSGLNLSLFLSSGGGKSEPPPVIHGIETDEPTTSSQASSPLEENPPRARPGSSKTQRATPPKTTQKAMQGTFDLQTSHRGRFDKSEPTIIGGEDLDIPTFIRKGVKLPVPPRR